MRLRLKWKWMALFLFLLLLFLTIQWYSFQILKKPLIVSSLFGIILILPFAYVLVIFLIQPIIEMAKAVTGLTSGISDRETHVYSDDELGRLSQAISEIGTQLKNKIEEISKEKDYLQTILRGMAEGVLVVDERSRIVMINEALRRRISISSDASDKSPLEIIRNAELEGAIRKVIQDGKGRSFELTVPSSDQIALDVNVVAICSSPEGGGRIRGAIAVFHDISRLKELERIRQDFVANVSHELRTPLTTIKGYAETLLEGALKADVALQFVQVIKRHSDRLTKIVEDLLTLSKIESREFHLKIESVLLSELIDDVLGFVREAAEKKKMSLSKSEIPSSLMVKADRHYLEQVFINLLENAIKYTPEGGTIKISATEIDQKEIRISVKDNGIGIPREDLPRIFERFYRVDKGRSQELGGTGLGLSIVKHIVQAHGDRVWAESQFGEGSTFHFTLPKNSAK